MAKPESKTLEQVEAELDGVKTGEKRSEPKELKVFRDSNGLFAIRFTAGGEVPDTLKGHWTSNVRAEEAVANYKATPVVEAVAA